MPRLQAADLHAVSRRHSRRRCAPLWLHPQSEAQPQEATPWGGRIAARSTAGRAPCTPYHRLAAKRNPMCPAQAERAGASTYDRGRSKCCTFHICCAAHAAGLCARGAKGHGLAVGG